MEKFDICWEATVQRSVQIEASSIEEAHKKWRNGDYDSVEVDDEDVSSTGIEINGEEYYINEFKKVF